MKIHSTLTHMFIEHLLFPQGYYLTQSFSGTLQADVETNREAKKQTKALEVQRGNSVQRKRGAKWRKTES